WREVFVVAGIGSLISVVITQIILLVIRLFYGSQGTSAGGFAGVLEMLSLPAFNPLIILISTIWSMIVTFIFLVICSAGIGYCLQLWFSESKTLITAEWLGFTLAAAMVKSFQLITTRTINESNRMMAIMSSLGQPNTYLLLTLAILSILFLIYGYYVLYR